MISKDKIIWSNWFPLFKAGRNKEISSEPGLYKIRQKSEKKILYIGETGCKGGLRRRLGMLSHIYKKIMPYRAPHTAGPALWAMIQENKIELETSICILNKESKLIRNNQKISNMTCGYSTKN